MRRLAPALALLLLTAAGAAAHPPAGHVALRAGRTFDGSRWHQGVTVLIHGDRITELRFDRSLPKGVELIDAPGAVLTPGLVDLDSALGLARGRDEWHEALSPDLLVVDGFAPQPAELAALRGSGVTAAWLAPGASGVLGGRGAVVQPAPAGEPARILARDWGPTGSLTADARRSGREPSSLPWQASMLARGLRGSFPGPSRVRFDDAASASRGARLGAGLLVGKPGGPAALAELSGARGVAFSGLGPGDSLSALGAPAQLARAGTSLGFGSASSPLGPAAVRLAAARAVQAGLDPAAALSALTGTAAGLAGLPGARGTLGRGAAADLVLWSGDPVEPASRALRVWVGGQEVHRAP